MQLALTGASIDARHAQSIGLVFKVVSQSQLDSEVGQLAERLSSMPPDAIRAAKQLLSPSVAWSDQRASEAFMECLTTETARQSIGKFRHS